MFTTSDINKKYNTNLTERELTEFEKQILNSEEILDISRYDLDDITVLNSISIYYYIKINEKLENTNSDPEKNLKSFFYINTRLIEKGDSRGALRITCYYTNLNNLDEAEKYGNIAMSINDDNYKLALFNLGIIYSNQGRYSNAISLLEHALSLGNYNSIESIILIYNKLENFSESLKWIEYGIYKSKNSCINIINYMLKEFHSFYYYYLSKLPFTNDLIENKKKELFPNIIQNEIDQFQDENISIIDFCGYESQHGSSSDLISIYG